MLSSLSLPLAFIVITWASVASASTQGRGLPSEAAARHQRLARAQQARSSHHWSLDQLPGGSRQRFVRARRGDNAQKHARGVTLSDPTNLAKGSLTVAQGCTKFYEVKPNDSCYSAIAASNPKLTLEEFYAMNPEVNFQCFNLWTNFQYCVEKGAPEKSKVKVHVASAKKAATTTETKKPVQTKKPVEVKKPVETKKPVEIKKPVETPSAPTDDDDEDEGDCDADEDGESTPDSTTKKPAKTTALAGSSGASQPKNTGGAVKAFVSGGTNNKGNGSHDDPSTSSAPPATTQQPNPSLPSPTGSSSPGSSSGGSSGGSYPLPSEVEGIMRARGIHSFLGERKNGIFSWFQTNSVRDSTNGNSWCYTSHNAYNDNVLGFAIDVTTMLANFDNSNIKAGKAFCGAVANFTSSDGKIHQLSMIDGFDSKWTRGNLDSADLTVAAFKALAGYFNDNKNDVLHGTWQWTGVWNNQYSFNGGRTV